MDVKLENIVFIYCCLGKLFIITDKIILCDNLCILQGTGKYYPFPTSLKMFAELITVVLEFFHIHLLEKPGTSSSKSVNYCRYHYACIGSAMRFLDSDVDPNPRGTTLEKIVSFLTFKAFSFTLGETIWVGYRHLFSLFQNLSWYFVTCLCHCWKQIEIINLIPEQWTLATVLTLQQYEIYGQGINKKWISSFYPLKQQESPLVY